MFILNFNLHSTVYTRKYLATTTTDEEIDRAKNALKTNVFSQFESNSLRADDLGRHVLNLYLGFLLLKNGFKSNFHYIIVNSS